jgi:hypothetical protein
MQMQSVHNSASPEGLGTGPLIVSYASDLKCRCYQFQILSRGFTLARSGQDHFDEVTSIHPLVRVKQGGLIGLNTLQRVNHRVLVPSGRMHCEGTKADNSHNDQHWRDHAYGDFCLEVLHKLRRLQAM